MRLLPLSTGLCAVALALTACSVEDSATARRAEKTLVGMSEVDLESCVGVPNRHDRFGQTSVMSYDGNSTSTGGMSFTLPVVGGISFSGGGYCHMNVRVDNGRVTAVHYTGETDAFLSPEAYCAPLVRACVQTQHSSTPGSSPPPPATGSATAAPVSPHDSKCAGGAENAQTPIPIAGDRLSGGSAPQPQSTPPSP